MSSRSRTRAADATGKASACIEMQLCSVASTTAGRVAPCVKVGHPLGPEARIEIDGEVLPFLWVCKTTGEVANVADVGARVSWRRAGLASDQGGLPVGLRFRRSFKLGPGVRLNVGKRGFSTSFGRRGAQVTVGGARGLSGTVGVPGSGLSYTSRISGSARSSRRAAATSTEVTPPVATISTHRVSEGKQRAKFLTTVVGLVFLVMMPWLGLIVLLVALFMPSRKQVLRRDLEARLDVLRREISDPVTLPMIARVLMKQKELDVYDSELGDFGERLHATKAMLEFQEVATKNDNQLPRLTEHIDAIRPDDACFFAAPCVYDKRGDNDPSGTLYLTDTRALFRSSAGATPIAWKKVIHIGREGCALHIQREDRQASTIFIMESLKDAMIGELLALNLRHKTIAAL